MNNENIADNFSLLSKLMDIHGENSFKTKSYSIAAFTIEKLATPLQEIPYEQIIAIKCIGEAVGKKIIEQINTGKLSLLEQYIANTPPGILEMLFIKGIGPKKIATIWKELEIETIGELLYACNENRLTLYKGFGEKTQQNIKEALELYIGSKGSYLYQQVEEYIAHLQTIFKVTFPSNTFQITGEVRRQLEIIEKIAFVTDAPLAIVKDYFLSQDFSLEELTESELTLKAKENITLVFYFAESPLLVNRLFTTSSSVLFLEAFTTITNWDNTKKFESEQAIFSENGIAYIPPALRETASIIEVAKKNQLPELIMPSDIKGIIHSHSKWSDGANSLTEMAKAAIEAGYEYLVISDHSQSAFYANGLKEERVLAQHQEIAEINEKLAPFKIYKSIESDILNDGSLDYPSEILSQFDVVIASIHSNLKMQEEKAMMRLMKAIENPYTSILGHLTGRLLLSRNGYPINHEKIIDACAANDVVIELNAHPRRLDIDWRWIHKAIDKNVFISINPDAHHVDGYYDCKYGVLVAQKAGLTKHQNLSSFSLNDFEAFVAKQKAKR